jgi:protein TonB
VGFLIAAAINAGFIAVLANGLEFSFEPAKRPETVATVVEEPKPPPTDSFVDRPPRTDDFVTIPIAEPDVDIRFRENVITAPPAVGPVVIDTGPPMNPAPVITPLRADPATFVRPNYPAMEIRGGHEGTVKLLIHVEPDGTVSEVRVAQSSGFARLDAAAVEVARTKWRFFPMTRDGQAVAAWGTYAVTFRIEN